MSPVPSPASKASRLLPEVVLWLVLGMLLVGACAGFAASLVPVSVMTKAMGAMSGSGDASGTIAEQYPAVVARARVTSALLLATWALLVWRRRWLGQALGRLLAEGTQAARRVPGWAGSAVRQAWRTERMETVLFVTILLGGVALRLSYLGRDIRHDEAWTYMVYARRPFYLSPIVMSEVNHHPLNTILMQLSVALFGNGPAAIRLPAFLFGVGCIPAGFVLARMVWGRGAALIAAAGIAGCSPLIEYSVNARGYSAVAFFGLVMLSAGFRAVRTGSIGAWVAVAGAGMAGTYANPVMTLPGIAAFVWFFTLLADPRLQAAGRKAAFRGIVLAGVGVAVGTLCLYLPFFTVSGWDVIASSQGIKARSSVSDALATVPGFCLLLLNNWDRDFSPATALIAMLLALLSLVLARRSGWLCAGLLLAVGAAALFQFVVVRDSGPERIWLSFLPMLLILAAAGLDGIIGRFGGGTVVVPGAAALLLGGLMAGSVVRSGTLLSSVETGYFPGARQVAHDLVTKAPTDLIAITRVRGDDVIYYALREGLLIAPAWTAAPLRFYRPASQRRDGWVFLVFDKVLSFCSVEECLGVAQRAVPTTGKAELLREESGFVEMRLKLAGPGE